MLGCFCAENHASVYVSKLYIKINFRQDLLLCVLDLQVKAFSMVLISFRGFAWSMVQVGSIQPFLAASLFHYGSLNFKFLYLTDRKSVV